MQFHPLWSQLVKKCRKRGQGFRLVTGKANVNVSGKKMLQCVSVLLLFLFKFSLNRQLHVLSSNEGIGVAVLTDDPHIQGKLLTGRDQTG